MFTDKFIHRPVMASCFNILLLVIGGVALISLPVRQYPQTRTTVVTITTQFPGAASDLVQGFVTQPLQQALANVPGIDYITSASKLGTSTITVYMRLNEDPNAAVANVVAQVQSVKYQLPQGVFDPSIVVTTGATLSVIYVGLYSETLNAQQLTDYAARVIQPAFATVSGVAAANIRGQQNVAVRIWLDPQRMALYSLSAQEVQQALTTNNRLTPAGQIRGYFTLFDVDARTLLRDPEEFRNLIVATRTDGIIRLRDVAQVTFGAENNDAAGFFNGQPGVVVAVDPTPSANPINIVDGINRIMPQLQRNLPDGIRMEVAYDSTVPIRISIEEVIKTLEEAVAIVIVVIFMFIGSFRAVAIPIIAIPLSVIGVCAVLAGLGFSINLLTLLAMVLAIGLVVDDAIVVVENVERHMAEGKSPLEASLIGTREIAVPVISMTVTLGAVYAPIAFQAGLTGALFKEFALTLAGSVFVSGFVALTLSPMLCAKILKRHAKPGRLQGAIERTLTRVQNGYTRILRDLLDYRIVVVLFAVIVFATLPFLFNAAKSELAPYEDDGLALIQMTGPSDANPDYMIAMVQQMLPQVSNIPEVGQTFAFTGVPQMNQGTVGGTLRPWAERERTQAQVVGEVQQRMSRMIGVKATAFNVPPLPGAGSGLPLQFVVTTTADYRTLNDVMDRLRQEMGQSGLFAFLDVDLRYESGSLIVRVNRDKAGIYGVTMDEIGAALQIMMSNGYVNRIGIDGRSYQVIPQAPRAFRLTPDAIEGFYVRSVNGQPVPLRNLVDVEIVSTPPALNQFNQLNSATLSGAMLPGVTLGQAIDAVNAAAERLLPRGFGHDYTAASRQYVQEGGGLVATFMLALIIIYLVLASQFESFRDPIVIMVSGAARDLRRAHPAGAVDDDDEHLQPGRADHAGRPDHQARHPDLRGRQGGAGEARPRQAHGGRDRRVAAACGRS